MVTTALSQLAVLLQVICDRAKVVDSLCVAACMQGAKHLESILHYSSNHLQVSGPQWHTTQRPPRTSPLSNLLAANDAANVQVHRSWKV